MTPVSVCIATRGDVPLRPIFLSIPRGWEIVWWNNGDGTVTVTNSDEENFVDVQYSGVPDLGPHARFAAIEYASHDLIYCQDDDVIVSDPELIVRQYCSGESYDATDKFRLFPDSNSSYKEALWNDGGEHDREYVICNMPQEFREHYPDSSLVGFGACFHRDAPERAFQRFFDYHSGMKRNDPLFLRESCRVFTVLTPRVLVDIDKQDLPYASDGTRLWRQPGHLNFRDRALTLAREVRDA